MAPKFLIALALRDYVLSESVTVHTFVNTE